MRIGGYYDKNSIGDSLCSRIRFYVIRGGDWQNRWPIALLVLPGSGYCDHEVPDRREPAYCRRQHEGCRRRSHDKGLGRSGFEGRQNLRQVIG